MTEVKTPIARKPGREILNITMADALGSLQSVIAKSKKQVTSLPTDDERQTPKALICIESRSAFTSYKDFLRWRTRGNWQTEEELLKSGKDLPETLAFRRELNFAIEVLQLLGAGSADQYLQSVLEKLSKLPS